MVQNGPDSTLVRSTTRNPSSGRMRLLPHFATKTMFEKTAIEPAAKPVGVDDGFLRRIHASFPAPPRSSKRRASNGLNSKNALHKATETVCMTNSGKRVSWVTGGGSGIGEAGAVSLAADGWTVVVSGRRKDSLDAVVAKITTS